MENEEILYVFPIFQTADWEQKIRRSAAVDLFRVSQGDVMKLKTRIIVDSTADLVPEVKARAFYLTSFPDKKRRKPHFYDSRLSLHFIIKLKISILLSFVLTILSHLQ